MVIIAHFHLQSPKLIHHFMHQPILMLLIIHCYNLIVHHLSLPYSPLIRYFLAFLIQI